MQYRTLGNSGAVVSSYALGTMTFGAEATEEQSRAILDAYFEAGGNFIDTADVYSSGVSEEIIGRWLADRAEVRDRAVIATKGRFPMGQAPNDVGTSRRHLVRALDDSLRRLGVEQIDLYQLHVVGDGVPKLVERGFLATGGLPDTEVLSQGNELVVSAWDIISGDAKPGKNVLIFDDAGDHAALQAAEVIAQSGARLEIVTPDRAFSPEVMAMNLVPYMRSLQDLDVVFTVTYRVEAVKRRDGKLAAIFGSDYGKVNKERIVDQVVINHGTLPMDELYFELRPLSSNEGAVEQHDLIAGKAQNLVTNPAGRFQLFRIGDAVAARNTHAAIYDALRLVKDL